jgi:hypothetical protein
LPRADKEIVREYAPLSVRATELEDFHMPVRGILPKENREPFMQMNVRWALRAIGLGIVHIAMRRFADFAKPAPRELAAYRGKGSG